MSTPRRLVAPDQRDDDVDASLRPQQLSEFIGQEQARANLKVFIEAARARKEALDHAEQNGLDADPNGRQSLEFLCSFQRQPRI